MSNDLVITNEEGGVLEIVLNRPAAHNALDDNLILALRAALELAEAPSVRVVLLRGAGKSFCVGGDVKLFADVLSGDAPMPEALPGDLHVVIETIVALPKPVIAAVHGGCAGAGLSLTLACDLVVASEDTKLSTAYLGVGLSPDGGSTWLLTRHVGPKLAMELFLAPAAITPQRALELGLVNRVVPADQLLASARAFAVALTMSPSQAVARTKALVSSASLRPLHDQLELEKEAITASFATRDFAEGVAAFLGKRAPRFSG